MRTYLAGILLGTALICSCVYAEEYEFVYESVRIVVPEPDTTVFDNSGNLAVRVAVAPPLSTGAGDRLTLLLDGNAVATQADLHFELTAVDRGAHTLQVLVVAADGRVLATSPPVKFYMWRASRLFPNRVK